MFTVKWLSRSLFMRYSQEEVEGKGIALEGEPLVEAPFIETLKK